MTEHQDRAPQRKPISEEDISSEEYSETLWKEILSNEERWRPDIVSIDEYQRLEQQVRIDELTGAKTRRELYKTMRILYETHATQLGFFFIDANNLKEINDSVSHRQGDAYLRVLSHRLIDAVDAEKSDVFRYGGDEFVVLMRSLTKPEDIAIIGKRLVAVCSGSTGQDGESVVPTASIGGFHIGTNSEDIPYALMAADTAMYDAKKTAHTKPPISAQFVYGDRPITVSISPSVFVAYDVGKHGILTALGNK